MKHQIQNHTKVFANDMFAVTDHKQSRTYLYPRGILCIFKFV